jgi:hypothetical protein
MHPKVFVKLKKNPKNPLVRAKKPKKTQKTQKTQKKTKKTQKKPTGLVFFKKPGFFPTLVIIVTNLLLCFLMFGTAKKNALLSFSV